MLVWHEAHSPFPCVFFCFRWAYVRCCIGRSQPSHC